MTRKVKVSLAALFAAAEIGDVGKIKLLIKAGANVNARNRAGWTALMVAANYGQIAVSKLLIENGADVQAQHLTGLTALMAAADYGQAGLVELLIEKGAEVDAISLSGRTALMFSAENGHTDVSKLLIEKGADINAKDKDDRSALNWARQNSQDQIAKILLENGAIVEGKEEDLIAAKDADIFDAFFLAEDREELKKDLADFLLAVVRGSTNEVRSYIKKGLDVNAKDFYGRTVLMLAVEHRQLDVVKILIENGADEDIQGKNGRTALMIAQQKGYIDIVDYFLGKDFYEVLAEEEIITVREVARHVAFEPEDIELDEDEAAAITAPPVDKDGDQSDMIDDGAVETEKEDDLDLNLIAAVIKGHEQLTESLLKNGADVDVKDEHGQTPLQIAACLGHTDVARILVENGADLEAYDKAGQTALMIAEQKKHFDIVKLLGGKVIEKVDWTGLIITEQDSRAEIAELILEKGVEIYKQDEPALLAMMIAGLEGLGGMAEFVIEDETVLDATDYDTRMVLKIEEQEKGEAADKLFVEYGRVIETKEAKGWTTLLRAEEAEIQSDRILSP